MNDPTHRPIRSFVMRTGRMTTGQARALEDLWPRYGVEYSPKELRMALVESSEGRIGSPIDELLLFCYHYDPSTGRYGLLVMNLIRIGGVLTVAFILGIMFLVRRRDAPTPAEGHA